MRRKSSELDLTLFSLCDFSCDFDASCDFVLNNLCSKNNSEWSNNLWVVSVCCFGTWQWPSFFSLHHLSKKQTENMAALFYLRDKSDMNHWLVTAWSPLHLMQCVLMGCNDDPGFRTVECPCKVDLRYSTPWYKALHGCVQIKILRTAAVNLRWWDTLF